MPASVPVTRPSEVPVYPTDEQLLEGADMESSLSGLSHADLTDRSTALLELVARLEEMRQPVAAAIHEARRAARCDAGWMDPRRFAAMSSFTSRVDGLVRRIRARSAVIDRYRGLAKAGEQTERIRATVARGDREARGFKLAARGILPLKTYVEICRAADALVASGEVDRNVDAGDAAGRSKPTRATRR